MIPRRSLSPPEFIIRNQAADAPIPFRIFLRPVPVKRYNLGRDGDLRESQAVARARMADSGAGSVTIWIGAMKAGEGVAAQELWTRYFATVVRVARGSLRNSSRATRDEEDIALSAFDSFFAAAARGRFPRLDNRDDLWRILVTITRRKAIDAENRSILAIATGARSIENAEAIVQEVHDRTAGREHVLRTSDELPAYESAIEHVSGVAAELPAAVTPGRPSV
jgi:hypothetical protein